MKIHYTILAYLALTVSLVEAQVSFVANETCYGTLTVMNGANASADTVSAWAWDFDGDGVYDDAWGQNTNFIFDTTGSYPIGLVVTFTNGGGDTTIQNIVIHALPQVNFFVDNLCADDSAIFTDNSSIDIGETIVGYYWDFNNDGIDDDQGQIVKYVHTTPGLYITKLRCVSDQGCSSSTEKQNEVFEIPNAGFSASTAINAGIATSFTNNTSISDGTIEIYSWDFGDGEGSSEVTPSHNFLTGGYFWVELIAISDQDCRDTTLQEVYVAAAIEPVEGLGVESEVITPNDDLINDFLKISGLDLYTNCKVTIYNRWNEVEFTTDSYSNDEDGAFTGKDRDAGAYYYVIECDDEEPVRGVINLLK